MSTPHLQRRRRWWAQVLAPLGVQSTSFLFTAPSSCQSVAQKRLRSEDHWRLVCGELGYRSSLGEVLELLNTVWDAPGSSFWDSELSGKLAHELLPLPGPAVTLFLSTHLSSLEGSQRRAAALWVSAAAKASKSLSGAGWTGRFVAVSGLAHLKRNNLAFAGRLI